MRLPILEQSRVQDLARSDVAQNEQCSHPLECEYGETHSPDHICK